jgi:hypothetical protein
MRATSLTARLLSPAQSVMKDIEDDYLKIGFEAVKHGVLVVLFVAVLLSEHVCHLGRDIRQEGLGSSGCCAMRATSLTARLLSPAQSVMKDIEDDYLKTIDRQEEQLRAREGTAKDAPLGDPG